MLIKERISTDSELIYADKNPLGSWFLYIVNRSGSFPKKQQHCCAENLLGSTCPARLAEALAQRASTPACAGRLSRPVAFATGSRQKSVPTRLRLGFSAWRFHPARRRISTKYSFGFRSEGKGVFGGWGIRKER